MNSNPMQRRFWILLGVLFLASCGKDKLQSKPFIKIKSAGPELISNGGVYTLEMEFGDKEGDISNTLYVEKKRTNSRVVPTIRDTFSLQIASFPKNPRGNLDVTLYYQNHLISAVNPPNLGGNPPRFEDDSLIIRFALRDLAGNVSDTVTTSPIVVSRN
jgi:hypothetical protein